MKMTRMTIPRRMIRMRSLQPSPVQPLVRTVVIVEPRPTGKLRTVMGSSISEIA